MGILKFNQLESDWSPYFLSMEPTIDQIAQALFREYLHRKGYQSTLSVFDNENVLFSVKF